MTSYLTSFFRRSAARKTYAELMTLDDHLLADIGPTRTDLHQMASGARTSRNPKCRTHE